MNSVPESEQDKQFRREPEAVGEQAVRDDLNFLRGISIAAQFDQPRGRSFHYPCVGMANWDSADHVSTITLPRKAQAAVLDIDGLIVDNEPICRDATIAVARDWGHDVPVEFYL